jgi:hypothetical protein
MTTNRFRMKKHASIPAYHDSKANKGAHVGVTGSNPSKEMGLYSYVVHETNKDG